MRYLVLLLAVALAGLAPAPASAQQLVTFDQVVTLTERGNGSGAFHFTIKPAATEPASWTSPVDYSKGTAHVHLEVQQKPSKRNTAITICFDGNLEGYGCIATGTYTDVGTYDTARVLPSATWQYGKIAWGKRRQEYHLVVKDPALGGTPGGRPASDYVPTTMRIVMTVVPPGGTYVPPPGTSAPSVDAGAGGAGGAGGGSGADAAPAPTTPADAAAADSAPSGGDPVTPNPPPTSPPGGTMSPPATPAPPAGGTTPPRSSNPPASNPTPTPAGSGKEGVSGACSFVQGTTSSSGLALPLVALVLVGLRRRRRR